MTKLTCRASLVTGVLAFVTVACSSEVERVPVATAGDVGIYDACAPASAAPDVGSLYFTVVNDGAEPDTLLRVTSPAGMAMLHDVVTDESGVTSMVHVPAVEIAPQSTLYLAPGSYHVMFSNLSEPLRRGDTVDVTLTFALAGEVTFGAPVLTYTEVVELLERRPEP